MIYLLEISERIYKIINMLKDIVNVECGIQLSVNPLVMSDSVRTYGLQSARLLYSCNSPGKNIGVGCRSLVQGIFLTQGLNLGLPHFRLILYHPSHHASPWHT